MNPLYPLVSARAEGRCEYCHAPEQVFNFAFEVEHITPRAAGGDDAPSNLALACESCNLFKGAATTGLDMVSGQFVSLFHPRRDEWMSHFAYNAQTGHLEGVTAIGRATGSRLKMKSAFQVRACQQWMQLGLYP